MEHKLECCALRAAFLTADSRSAAGLCREGHTGLLGVFANSPGRTHGLSRQEEQATLTVGLCGGRRRCGEEQQYNGCGPDGKGEASSQHQDAAGAKRSSGETVVGCASKPGRLGAHRTILRTALAIAGLCCCDGSWGGRLGPRQSPDQTTSLPKPKQRQPASDVLPLR